MPRRRATQLALDFHSWGGKRKGAGRPRNPGRRTVPHIARGVVPKGCPVHVTYRVEEGVGSLRHRKTFGALCRAFDAAKANEAFRLTHFCRRVADYSSVTHPSLALLTVLMYL